MKTGEFEPETTGKDFVSNLNSKDIMYVTKPNHYAFGESEVTRQENKMRFINLNVEYLFF